MEPADSTTDDAHNKVSLPPSFTSCHDIRHAQQDAGYMVNLAGLVKDVMSPHKTKATDWRMTISLFDATTEQDPGGLKLVIFRPENQMPTLLGPGDVLVIFSAKVQSYYGERLLITNYKTDIHVYAAEKIPSPPASAASALKPPHKKIRRHPADDEHTLVSRLYHGVEKDGLPDETKFKVMEAASANVKDKFVLLQDCRTRRFCDVVAQVCKKPFQEFNRTTLYVTDYTENEAFYDYPRLGAGADVGRDGDQYGYTSRYTGNKDQAESSSSWPGPYGRLTMQVTCWDIQAIVAHDEVKAQDWVRLRNVRIKEGTNGAHLEGAISADREYPDRRYIEVLDADDPDTIDPKLKDALRRKRRYLKLLKTTIKAEERKRKSAADEAHLNTKERRKRRREKEKQQQAGEGSNPEKTMNEDVVCEYQREKAWPLSIVAQHALHIPLQPNTSTDNKIPFPCRKYRTFARVVDFYPPELEQFAVSRKCTEFDLLSDDSDDSDDDDEEEDEDTEDGERGHSRDDNGKSRATGTLDAYRGKRVWEWRFALLLEDPLVQEEQQKLKETSKMLPSTSRSNPADQQGSSSSHEQRRDESVQSRRIWALVDNREAQLLLNMDACDLKRGHKDLDILREKLFRLWGNLEENKKTHAETLKRYRARQHQIKIEKEKTDQARMREAQRGHGRPPPMDSDDDVVDGVDRHNGKRGRKKNNSRKEVADQEPEMPRLSNKPFTCCLRSYRKRERDDETGNPIWTEQMAMFGIKIQYS